MLTVNYKQKFNVEELTLTKTVWSGRGTRGGSCREHTGTMLRLERGAPWEQEKHENDYDSNCSLFCGDEYITVQITCIRDKAITIDGTCTWIKLLLTNVLGCFVKAF